MEKLQGYLFNLSDIPLEMRQYFEEVEVQCGKPWERVVEKETVREYGDTREMAKTPLSVVRAGWREGGPTSKTVGWQPTCTCGELVDSGALDPNMGTGIDVFEPYPPTPCTILDPFSGTGTTGLVADRLGRDAILIDLNPDYCQMAYDRIKGENPMFTEVTLE